MEKRFCTGTNADTFVAGPKLRRNLEVKVNSHIDSRSLSLKTECRNSFDLIRLNSFCWRKVLFQGNIWVPLNQLTDLISEPQSKFEQLKS